MTKKPSPLDEQFPCTPEGVQALREEIQHARREVMILRRNQALVAALVNSNVQHSQAEYDAVTTAYKTAERRLAQLNQKLYEYRRHLRLP